MTPERRQRLRSARAAILQALDSPRPEGALAAIPGLTITRLGVLIRLRCAGLDASSTRSLAIAARNWTRRADTLFLMEHTK